MPLHGDVLPDGLVWCDGCRSAHERERMAVCAWNDSPRELLRRQHVRAPSQFERDASVPNIYFRAVQEFSR